MSKQVNEKIDAFETDLKTTPRLTYPKYRAEVITWASNRCNEITGPSGLLAWILTPQEWINFPPNRSIVLGVLVIAPIFDILTPIEPPANNANNAVVKIWEVTTNKRVAIVQNLQVMKIKPIHSMPNCDISEMSDVVFGMTSVTNAQILGHLHTAYSELDQNDYSIIYSRLQTAKLPTEDYKTLAETHRDLHALLVSSGQPFTELAKNQLFYGSAPDRLIPLKWQLALSSIWWPLCFCMLRLLYQLQLRWDIPMLRQLPLSPLQHLLHQRLKLR